MTNGNGLFRELTETKERAAAWVFRLVLTILTGLLSVVGYLIISKMNDFQSSIEHQGRVTWDAISELNRSNATITNTLAGLTATFADHVKDDEKTDVEFSGQVQDHEKRIRTLEADDQQLNSATRRR